MSVVHTDGIRIPEQSAPATPPSGQVEIYAKSGGGVYAKDSAGTETPLGVAGSGGGNACSCTVDFGTGRDSASIVVTGQSWVTPSSKIICQALGEDARIEGIICNADTIVDGVGFTVHAQASYIAVGQYTINCIGV